MSNTTYAAVPAYFRHAPAVTLIAANGTAAKVLVDPMASAVASIIAPPTPLYYGGGTVLDMTATSTDGSDKILSVWHGYVATTVGSVTGAVTTTTSTIPRASGSWVTDGWLVGDLVMTFAPTGVAPNASVDGVLGIVTAVSTSTLTLSGTPLAALALATGTRICRMSHLFKATVAANSGTNGTLSAVSLVNSAMDGSALRYERKLGESDLIAISAASAISTLPAYINVAAQVARY